MCGIAGIIERDGHTPIPPDELTRMVRTLQHRGPDDEGYVVKPGVGLGMRRLSIIDVAGGQQPFGSEDDRIQLVANGEIYNFEEIKRDLIARGHQFTSRSDIEVLVHAYEEYGEAFLTRLRGMFALALWDGRTGTFIAARDRAGEKPLYYTQTPRGLLVASEIKALLVRPEVRRELSHEALDQFLTYEYVIAPRTIFKDIWKLPAGHFLRYKDGRVEVQRYWDASSVLVREWREDDAVEALRAALRRAVTSQMMSDVPLGVFLSGGIDSSAIVAFMSEAAARTGARVNSFSMGFESSSYNELPFAREVAEAFKTVHREQTVTPDLVRLFNTLVVHLDEPFADVSLFPTYLVSRLAREHVTVALAGDGGDELFGGYDRYYGNLYASHYRKVPEAVRRRVLAPAVALIPESGWYKSVGHQLRWLHHLSFHSGGARYAASLSYFYFDRERRAELFAPQVAQWRNLDAEAAIRAPYEESTGGPLDKMLFADSMVRLPNHPVMITDRICMAHGLEARSPFMDHELAAFAARLAPALKVRGGTLRYIQRKLAARYLPPQILNRPKQGFSSALPYLLQREYAQLYSSCLRDSRLAQDRILDGAVMTRLVDEHLAKRADHGNRLWLLINAEVWYRMAILGQSKEDMRSELAYEQREKKAVGCRL